MLNCLFYWNIVRCWFCTVFVFWEWDWNQYDPTKCYTYYETSTMCWRIFHTILIQFSSLDITSQTTAALDGATQLYPTVASLGHWNELIHNSAMEEPHTKSTIIAIISNIRRILFTLLSLLLHRRFRWTSTPLQLLASKYFWFILTTGKMSRGKFSVKSRHQRWANITAL